MPDVFDAIHQEAQQAPPPNSGDIFDQIHAAQGQQPTVPLTPKTPPPPNMPTMSAYQPSVWERFRSAFPVVDRIEAGLSGPAKSNLEALAKPAPGMSDERAIAPEQAMTPSERQAHPVLTGAGEFAGGMTTPENMLLTGATFGAPAGIARPMGAAFGVQMLRGAYQEYQPFREAVDRGDRSEAERLATHMVLGATMATIGAVQSIKGESPYERYSEAGREFAKLKRQHGSKDSIETNGVGLYNNIRQDFQTHIEALRNDGAKTIQTAIDADKAALMNTNRGSISTSPAIAEATKALMDTDYSLKPVERTLYNRLVNQSELTLDEAKHLRTAFGRAAASARRSDNRAGEAVFNAAYNQLGTGMRDRIIELQGTSKPFNHYNNQFRASFDLEKNGITSEMLNPIVGDANASIGKLDKFSDANLKEIQKQMHTIGLDRQAKSIEQSQKDARVLVGAHDVANGKYQSGVYRLFAQNPKQAWPGLAVMLAAHGMKMPFPLPQLLGMVVAGGRITRVAKSKAGELGMQLRSELPEEYFRTRPEAEAPETYTYKNPDEGWTGELSANPQAQKAEAVKAAKRARGLK